MVIEVYGNALESDCDVLCHQVNLHGVMGAGIAAQIACSFPKVKKEYANYADKSLGKVCFATAKPGLVIANCFSQNESFVTDYRALKECLNTVSDYMTANGLSSVAFPYHYGCGIASGDWNVVLGIIDEAFKDRVVKIYKRRR